MKGSVSIMQAQPRKRAKKRNRRAQRTTGIGKKPPVAVCLRRQPIMPVFLDAVDACTRSGLMPDHKIGIDSGIDQEMKLWLDAPLFKEALVDMLRDAARHTHGNHGISVSISPDGMHFCRIAISYLLKAGEDEAYDDRFAHQNYCNSRTQDIVSQHRASLGLRKDNRKITIDLCFPN
jgi:hypothetical protein